MSRCRPILGYPSTTAAILAMRTEGKDTQEIAERVGLLPSHVLQRELTARRAVKRNEHRQITLTRELTMKIEAEARRLTIPAPRLAHLLLTLAMDEGLTDSILDGAR